MKKRINIISLLMLLVTFFAFGTNVNSSNINAEAKLASEVDSYYSSLYDESGNLKYKGEELLTQLNTIISSNHTNKGYDDLAGIYKTADVDPADSNRVILYYTGESRKYDFASYSGAINREHVWCQSHFGYSDNSQTSPYSDAHQVRPCDAPLNSLRNNSYYDELIGVTPDSYGNMAKGGIFYPRELYRGDVARICFYVATRYLDLSFVDNASSGDTGTNKQMGNISALIKWNLLYDVTDTELRRNDAVEKKQGNRNPFIDHPEYASYIWGDFNEKTQSIIDEYTYNITFDTNDGSSITSQEVLRNAKVVKPYTPIKKGFKFVGWYEDEALTKVYNFDNKVFSDRTLYAKWIEENKESPSIYQVTFDSNGGNEVTSLSVEEGLTINKPVNPKKINHEFSSWNLNGSPFDFSSPITSDINLTASWEVLERETSLVATSNYELVKDASTLKVGDKVVIGITSKEVVTGSLNGTYLSPLEAEFSSDASKINMIDENYLEFTLGGRSGAWTLSNNGKLLGCTAVKKLDFDSGITTWTISISGNNASIYSTNSSYGRILFNSSSPRFTTYTSNPTASMILPNLYKFIPSEEDLGPGGNNEFRNQTIETNLGFSYKCEEIVNDGAYLTKDIAMDFSLQGYQNAEEVKSLEKEGVTATFDIGSNPYNAPKYYNDGKSIRIYGGGTLTVSSESVITSIAITFGPSDGTNDITVNEGSYLSGMWSGRSTSITFKVSGLTGQRRIASIITTIETDEKGTVIEEDWTFSNFYMNFKTEINENVFDAQDENATFGLLIKISNDLEYNYDSVSLEEFDNLYNKENGYINIEFDKQDIKYENGKYILSSKIDNILEEQISTNITTVFYVKNTDSVVFSNVNIKSISTMIEMYLDYANNLELSDFEIKVLKALKKEYDL